MSVICPKCGKDDITFFSDTIFKTTGIHCNSCNCDFAVDLQDKSLIKHYIDNLISVHLVNIDDKDNYKTFLFKENKLFILEVKNGKQITDLLVDLQDNYNVFINLLFYKLYILDFPDSNTTSDNDDHFIKLELSFNDINNILYRYHNYKPVYFIVLDELLSPFLEKNHE